MRVDGAVCLEFPAMSVFEVCCEALYGHELSAVGADDWPWVSGHFFLQHFFILQ